MKPIQEVYPEVAKELAEDNYFSAPGDYQPLLKSFGYEIAVQVDDKDYSGDSRLLLKDGARLGILIFGWGSCSGCDALQRCNSFAEIDELRTELFDQIKWFDSKQEALSYVRGHDWEGDYGWRSGDGKAKEFVQRVLEILEAA